MRKLLTIIIAFCIVIGDVVPAMAFSDIYSHWARNTIDHLEIRGLVRGRTSQLFLPDAPVTRVEFATLLINGLDKKDEATALQSGYCVFRDVDPSFWGKGTLQLGYEMGLIIPDKLGRCYPNRSITRSEAAVMINRALHLTQHGETDFIDNSSIPIWAKEAVTLVVDNQIMGGFPDHSFRPNEVLTRAQASTIIENIMGFKGQKYHGMGTLTQLNMPVRSAVMNINGKEYSFDLSARFMLKQLHPETPFDLPIFCYFDLDDQGDLVYCQQSVPNLSSLQISISNDPFAVYPSVSERPVFLVPETGEKSDSRVDVTASSQLNLLETHTTDLRNLTGATGKGVKIAVIDTGIDPGHPDLLKTTDGKDKIIEWADVTNSGKVDMNNAQIVAGIVQLPEGNISMKGLTSLSGRVRYGYLMKSSLPIKTKSMPDQNLLVLALDTKQSGQYDTILVDTDSDGTVVDEKPLRDYSVVREFGTIISDSDKPFNFVVSAIDPRGIWVKFGFDANGHGTKVAGILSANGLMQGVAPGSQIVAVKVSDGFGGANINDLLNGIRVAADKDVKLINISMGYASLQNDQRKELDSLITKLQVTKGISFCIAAGNLGPGLGTMADPSNAEDAIGVGGYLTPNMWLLNYGWKVKQSTLWQFSSVGPGENGLGPLVVAPASAATTNACWLSDYSFDEGTSISAPYVTGGMALLIDSAARSGLQTTQDQLRRSIAASAEPLPGYLACESGYGAVNFLKAWQLLKEKYSKELVVSQGNNGQGYYARQYLPAKSTIGLTNQASSGRMITLNSTVPWIKISQGIIQIPANKQRKVELRYEVIDRPGLYCGYITGDDPNTKGIDLEALQTIIVPYQLPTAGSTLNVSDEISGGMYHRYYYRVPDGVGKLHIKITIPRDGAGSYAGRVRMHLIDPTGNVTNSTGYAGAGYPETTSQQYIEVYEEDPRPGVWELVVYGSVNNGQDSILSNKYSIEADLKQWTANDAVLNDRYLITSVPPTLNPGIETWLTINIWDKISKSPFNGRVVINNCYYEAKDGQVELRITPGNTVLKLELKIP
ncbi:MAG: S8 family serine peptidase [Acidobacteriota bacterium]